MFDEILELKLHIFFSFFKKIILENLKMLGFTLIHLFGKYNIIFVL